MTCKDGFPDNSTVALMRNYLNNQGCFYTHNLKYQGYNYNQVVANINPTNATLRDIYTPLQKGLIMKTILYCILCVCAVVLASGCEKSSKEKTENLNFLNQPKSLDIDINSDLITDFRIDYKWLQTNDVPSSGKSLIGYIQPLNENEVLYKKGVGNLFLLKNDTVSFTPTSTMIWNKYQADLITNNGLDSIWTILSSNLIGDFYLGFQLKTSNKNYIGWMQVDIHKNNGIISIINMKLTESEFLIIED